MAQKCYGCGEFELTPEFDSEAHIIPNALGGGLAPRGLICRECNTLLERLADNSLIRAFGPWPTLIDVPRHRGQNPPVMIETADGERVRVEPDGKTSRAEVVYEVTQLDEGEGVRLGADDWEVVKQLINRAKKEFPQLDVAQAQAHAKRVKIPASARNGASKRTLHRSTSSGRHSWLSGCSSFTGLRILLLLGRASLRS